MILYKNGNILESTEKIICHQCNTQGIFGGGLAYQIKTKYPNCEISAINHVKTVKNKCNVVGTYNIYFTKDEKEIANCFTQDENFNTNYEALEFVFSDILEYCKIYNKTIAIPFKYGCGIANGDWEIVLKTFEKLSNKFDVDIVIYKLKKENDKI